MMCLKSESRQMKLLYLHLQMYHGRKTSLISGGKIWSTDKYFPRLLEFIPWRATQYEAQKSCHFILAFLQNLQVFL